VLLQGIGYSRHDTVYAAGLKWCEAEGMGSGEAGAHFQNLRGFTAIFMPLFYARLYAVGVRSGVPGINFFVAGGVTALAGVWNNSIPEIAYKGPLPKAAKGR
jgi:hypothetical protein